MPAKWIDFKVLKGQVKIRDVLGRYGFLEKLRETRPGKLAGPCPLHGGTNGTSFHVDCERNVFHCFSQCGGGNVVDLVMKVERCGIRDAGVKLTEWFGLSFERPKQERVPREAAVRESANVSQKPAPPVAAPDSASPANPPLGRQLVLDSEHAYLWARGLNVATVQTFGVGFCKRGIMRGRIAIPIHDHHGELVAYAGRAVDDQLASSEGKYKLPAGFQKSHVVYNLHRAASNATPGLIVVEGFFDVMKVHQAGFPNVVALMGSQLADPQIELLAGATDRLTLLFDGDEAGLNCTREFWKRLRRRMFLREIALPHGQQPDSVTAEVLVTLLGGQHA